jgi:hypothetical protein
MMCSVKQTNREEHHRFVCVAIKIIAMEEDRFVDEFPRPPAYFVLFNDQLASTLQAPSDESIVDVEQHIFGQAYHPVAVDPMTNNLDYKLELKRLVSPKKEGIQFQIIYIVFIEQCSEIDDR